MCHTSVRGKHCIQIASELNAQDQQGQLWSKAVSCILLLGVAFTVEHREECSYIVLDKTIERPRATDNFAVNDVDQLLEGLEIGFVFSLSKGTKRHP